MRLRRPGGGFDLLAGGIRLAEGDILGNRTRKEKDILLDDGNVAAQILQVPIAHVYAIHQHLPRTDVVGAVDQPDEGGLAGAGLTHNRHRLTGLYLEADLLQHGLPAGIGKSNLAKFHFATQRL